MRATHRLSKEKNSSLLIHERENAGARVERGSERGERESKRKYHQKTPHVQKSVAGLWLSESEMRIGSVGCVCDASVIEVLNALEPLPLSRSPRAQCFSFPLTVSSPDEKAT